MNPLFLSLPVIVASASVAHASDKGVMDKPVTVGGVLGLITILLIGGLVLFAVAAWFVGKIYDSNFWR